MLYRVLSFLEKKIHAYLLSEKAYVSPRWSKFLAWYYPDACVRKKYLQRLGVEMGNGTLSNVGLIPIIGRGGKVSIGKNVSIGPNLVLILDSDPNNGHRIKGFNRLESISEFGDITIEDEAWIGANVTIFPNVTVGECAILGAGCVLTKDADSYGIYVGVPARKIGDIRDEY